MSDQTRIHIHQQTVFAEDGELEAKDEAIETTLEDHGVAVDHRARKIRIDRPVPNEFGTDDRPELVRKDPGEQGTLFVDVDENQSTLDGGLAAFQPLFEIDKDHS